jgi:DNA segregation ATPase FtsK/SpoIIIE, S-DNA-T family
LWDDRTTSRYQRFMRAAEATGNHEAALEWDDRIQTFRRDRHQRRMDAIQVPVQVLLAVPKIALGAFLVLAVLGTLLAIATGHVAEAAAPFETVAHIVAWVALAVSIAWGPVVLSLPWIGLGVLWHVGRTAGTGPSWTRTAADADADVTIDEATITRALVALRIPQITEYSKSGMPMQYITRADATGAERTP